MEAKHEWLLLWRNHEKSTYCELISAECWRILQVCSEETARTKAEPEDQDYYGNMALSEAASPTFHIFTKFLGFAGPNFPKANLIKGRVLTTSCWNMACRCLHARQTVTELQVDWNSSGPGLVKHEVGTREQCQVQDQKPVYSRGERVLLGGLKTVSMNGQAGTITTLLASGRYGVLLSDGGKIAVRPCHLQPLHGRRHCLLNDLQCHWR